MSSNRASFLHVPPSAKIQTTENPKGLNLCPSGATSLLPFLEMMGERGRKWADSARFLVTNLQHLKKRESSLNRQRHDVAPFPLNFWGFLGVGFFPPPSPSPLSFLPVGALNRIPAVVGMGRAGVFFCFVCAAFPPL